MIRAAFLLYLFAAVWDAVIALDVRLIYSPARERRAITFLVSRGHHRPGTRRVWVWLPRPCALSLWGARTVFKAWLRGL